MTDIIHRLEEAEGGSDELSAWVIHAVRAPDGRVECSPINARWCVYDARGRLLENSSRNGWWREGGWNVTESLDAALSLAERVLPGLGAWDIGHAYNAVPPYQARLVVVREGDPEIFARAATPALALCAAILRTMKDSPNV